MVEILLDSDPLEKAQAYEIPDLNSASIEEYYPYINSNWALGTQAVTKEGQIFSRTFNQLEFLNTNYSFNRVDLPAYDDFYEGTHYYLLANDFCEDIYTSSISQEDPAEDFLRWQHYSTFIRQQVHYSPKKVKQLTWNKPVLNAVPPTSVKINGGYGVKANITILPATANVVVKLKSEDGLEEIVVEDINDITLTLPIIEVTMAHLPGTDVDPDNPPPLRTLTTTLMVFNFYGEVKLQTFVPSFSRTEPEILTHPIKATLAERLKPPGLPNLRDNFWNSQPNDIVLTDWKNRTSTPGFL